MVWGLCGLVFDFDNILILYKSYEDVVEIIVWVVDLCGVGIWFYLLSNVIVKCVVFWLLKLGFDGVGMVGKFNFCVFCWVLEVFGLFVL